MDLGGCTVVVEVIGVGFLGGLTEWFGFFGEGHGYSSLLRNCVEYRGIRTVRNGVFESGLSESGHGFDVSSSTNDICILP